MHDQIRQVISFQCKYGFEVGVDCSKTYPKESDKYLELAYSAVHDAGEMLEEAMSGSLCGDNRLLRAHLMCEELAEIMRALIEQDREKLLDGITDLLYVTVGTGTNLPLAEAFEEIQRSNMTKELRQPTDVRLRNKGSAYEPPDLKKVLKEFDNNCQHNWGTDGQHSNEFCKKCYISKPENIEDI